MSPVPPDALSRCGTVHGPSCRVGTRLAGCSPCRRVWHAVGGVAHPDPSVDRRPGLAYPCRHCYHHHRSIARFRRIERRLSPADPNRLRPFHRFRGDELLPVLLLLRRRGADFMSVEGFKIPLHRALTEPMLMGGAHGGHQHRLARLGLGARAPALARGICRLGRWPCGRRLRRTQGPGLHAGPHPTYPPQGSSLMLNLVEYRKRPALLANYLPWICLVAPLRPEGERRRPHTLHAGGVHGSVLNERMLLFADW